MRKTINKSPLTRSEVMSRIRGRDTSPEISIRSSLHALGYRFRVSYKTPGGKVDVAFPKLKVAIQIDGCFWHSCPIHGAKPKTNVDFWIPKLLGNRKRDAKQNKILKTSGWKLVRFWEHQVESNPARVVKSIQEVVEKQSAKINRVSQHSRHRQGNR